MPINKGHFTLCFMAQFHKSQEEAKSHHNQAIEVQ